MNRQEGFQRTKRFLVCVDSDGCAMDTMEDKHRACFYPELLRVWKLEAIRDTVERLWLHINLYSETRGINRFQGLSLLFRALEEKGKGPVAEDLYRWTTTAPALSNPALKQAVRETGSQILRQALDWSEGVNRRIAALPGGEPFPNVRKALEALPAVADVVVVSSANGSALCEEWTRCGLLPLVQALFGQEAGTKERCIANLLAHGYSPGDALMVGDSPGDLAAAQANGIAFYPILVGEEKAAWEELCTQGVPNLVAGTYGGGYQEQMMSRFYTQFDNNEERNIW